jgi:hypothetical protein
MRRRKQKEAARLAKARHEYRYPNRSHHAQIDKFNIARTAERRIRAQARLDAEFILWDGESPTDAGYALFGCSKHPERAICHPYLSTQECLEHLVEIESEYPDAIHISFGFNLDVSYILKDLPHRALSQLHQTGQTIWGVWEIWHIPHKWFRVRRGQVDIKVFDIHTFVPGGYVSSLLSFNVGTPEEIARLAAGKANRPTFLWADMAEIREYWELELKLGPLLGDAIRESMRAVSMVPVSWHGPGAVARLALQKNDTYKAMAKCPAEVAKAARYAFAGGRFEPFIVGYISSTIYEYDIRSAYPYYATMLPNLARGVWRRGKDYEPGKFALYHIIYKEPLDPMKVYPLFRRYPDHSVAWGNRVESWYWAPEAALVVNDPAATFVESLVFEETDPTDRPFSFLKEYYANRQKAKDRGDPAAYAYKIIINAIYGQLAQRAGWDRKRRRAPRSHQLEWAGYITSACRAAVYEAGISAGSKLISINTDSVQTLCPLDNLDCGDNLGQWDRQEYSEGIFWQSGIYYLREDLGYQSSLGYGWIKARTRGIPKGTYTPEQLIKAVETGEVLTITKHMFIGYTLADNGRWEELNTWKDEPHEFALGGNGKRKHLACEERCESGYHRLSGGFFFMPAEGITPENAYWSALHYLPWLDEKSPHKQMMDDIMAWEVSELGPDDDWMEEYELSA